MAKQSHLVRFNFTGGIISPGYLLEILEAAEAARVEDVRFGLRQQLFLQVPFKHFDVFENTCRGKGVEFQLEDGTPNITSSYPAAGIFINDSWLTEGTYKDIFDAFAQPPALKVNICDSRQTFVPLFSGHINWIASPHPHYWYLYVRYPGQTESWRWPRLIYTNSIPQVTALLEKRIISQEAPAALLNTPLECIHRDIDKELELPAFRLPYYEGFNRHNEQYWLGIYRRDEIFDVRFLKDMCSVCLETGIGQFYATPWKSVIIKNIEPSHRKLWDYVLGKHGINVRHAANELNWQVADHCEDSLILKRHIIRHFDTADVRTYGLCFNISLDVGKHHFGSIVIRRQENKHRSKLKYLQRYDVLYTPDFNPNTHQLIPYRSEVLKEHLGPYIAALCRQYYEKGTEWNVLQEYVSGQKATTAGAVPEKTVHQCPSCMTVYDEAAGDVENGIEAGTPVALLPEDYACYICGTAVRAFAPVAMSALTAPLT